MLPLGLYGVLGQKVHNEVVSTATPSKTNASEARAIGGTIRITLRLGGLPPLAFWVICIFRKVIVASKVVAPNTLRWNGQPKSKVP